MLKDKHNLLELIQLIDEERTTDCYTLGPLSIRKYEDYYELTIKDESWGGEGYVVRIDPYVEFTRQTSFKEVTFEEALAHGVANFTCDHEGLVEHTGFLGVDRILVQLGRKYFPKSLDLLFKHGHWFIKDGDNIA